jgi:tetratricopeptide (TPR) repeat protein
MDLRALLKRDDLRAGFAILLVTLGVFAPLCWCDFVNYDDHAYVVDNVHVRSGLTSASATWAFSTLHFANWHPLTWLSLELDHELYGLNAGGYHFTNLLLHSANSLLVFWLLRRMTGKVWCSAAVAALFALHPLHVETVAWIAERKGVLSSFFGLLAILAYVRYAEMPTFARYCLVAGLFALGLMAKPMLVTLPAVLLLLDYWPLRRWPAPPKQSKACEAAPVTLSRLVLEKVPLLLMAAALGVATITAQGLEGAQNSWSGLPTRLANVPVGYAAYLRKTAWPSDLAVHYEYPEVVGYQTLLCALALLAVSYLVWRRRHERYLVVGWLWFLGILVPTAGFFRILGGHLIADRYTYLPLIGLFLMVVWAGADCLQRRPELARILIGGLAVALVACAVLSWLQVQTWRNSVTLWEHALAVAPRNATAEECLGRALKDAGRDDSAVTHLEAALRLPASNVIAGSAHSNLGDLYSKRGALAEALRHYEESLALVDARDTSSKNGLFCSNHSGIAVVRFQQRRFEEAIHHFNLSLEGDPRAWHTRLKLALALRALHRYAEAERHFAGVVELDAASSVANFGLGEVLARQNRLEEAVACYRRALALDPANVSCHCHLAGALQQLGNSAEAEAEYQKAFRLNPHWAEQSNQRAWILSTHPSEHWRDGRSALPLAEQICEATGYQNVRYLDTLAAAQAETGQFDEARKTARQAQQLATAELKDAIAARLRLYEQNQPVRLEPRELSRP